MKKLKINYNIISQDTSASFITEGEYKNQRIKFLDHEGNTNYIIFKNDVVEYYKKGSVEMKFVFDIQNQTEGSYSVSGYQLAFTINTKLLQKTDTKLIVEYDLYQGTDLVNNTKLNVEYTSLKED